MAWMAMMGADSVAYHYANAAERADDHAGQALDYYGSRGETPLRWGGSGAAGLGLAGAVTRAQFEALYGPGGAKDPTTGERLVKTERPGMELVIAAHKSVAELGVIGRADDMHAIMDAERDATLSYLDRLTREVGGRRGREARPTLTGGLIYAVTRHATSRAGDPNPHDHVLVANVVSMADEWGGWKAATTALWRGHLQAATMVGRAAGAYEAVRLGYGIVPDDGPTGKLRHWAIAGVPDEVMAVHSKRAEEIGAEMARLGYSSYVAKGIVARDTRAHKRHEPVGQLLARWQAELESVGWPVAELARAIDEARPPRSLRREHLDRFTERRLIDDALAPDGPLAERKVFARRDAIVALAPRMYGLHPYELEVMAERVLADPEAVPLVAVASASERPYATATTIAREQAIAAAVDIEVARTDAPAVADIGARRALAAREQELGTHLTGGQRAAVLATTTTGRGMELVVGVAGSGKTTALAALREAFEAEGYRVIGTSTSGQAARTLGRAAGIDPSRTLASLTWRLEHGQASLDDRTVVVLDEAAMADDRMMPGLLHHAAAARAKVVMVGDHRQLGAVGPGGGFEALVARYGDAVHVLADNVRQRDVAERAALAQLRDGNVARAVAWYADNGRVVVAPDRAAALEKLVEAWAADVAEHDSVAMYAYRRANVAELNRLGREVWRSLGRLGETELVAPGGARYAVGDRVVTLAAVAGGKVVTSETGTVVALSVEAKSLSVRMDDGNDIVKLEGPEIAASRLAHAYAVTVHRSQGSTVERAHALEDSGGRELAYVKMSRAKQRSTVYVVADSLDQAAEDLRREWGTDRRLGWVIDSGTPMTDPPGDRDEPGRGPADGRRPPPRPSRRRTRRHPRCDPSRPFGGDSCRRAAAQSPASRARGAGHRHRPLRRPPRGPGPSRAPPGREQRHPSGAQPGRTRPLGQGATRLATGTGPVAAQAGNGIPRRRRPDRPGARPPGHRRPASRGAPLRLVEAAPAAPVVGPPASRGRGPASATSPPRSPCSTKPWTGSPRLSSARQASSRSGGHNSPALRSSAAGSISAGSPPAATSPER